MNCYSQNYAMFYNKHEEPSFSISRGGQEAEYILCFSHFMASIWDHVYFIPPCCVLLMLVRSKGKWIFFLYPFLIKEKIRRQVESVTLQKPPFLESYIFLVRLRESITHHLGNSEQHSDKLFGQPTLVDSFSRTRLRRRRARFLVYSRQRAGFLVYARCGAF